MRSAALITNPAAGRHHGPRRIDRLRRALEDAGFTAEPVTTHGPGEATTRARELAGRVEVVFALGGDGTLREVAAGLLGSDTALGCLPAGTANVYAYALGIPRSPLAAARTAGELVVREVDVGLCGEVPFLMMVSGGWDAALMARPGLEAKRRLGKLAVIWEGLLTWATFPNPPIRLRIDGERHTTRLAAACNIAYYGGHFQIAPSADFTDRRLEAVLFGGYGRLALAGFLRDLALYRHLRRDDVELLPFRELVIEGPEDLTLQMDGDPIHAELPVTIRLAEERLNVLMRP